MIMNTNDMFKSVTEWLTDHSVDFESNRFQSGAYMIDIRHRGKLYVVQIEKESFGFSLVEEPDFSTIPDIRFASKDAFFKHLEKKLK